MTLVALWLDWENQDKPRLLCFADSQITNTQTNTPITKYSTKIFRLPILLYNLKDLSFIPNKPYFNGAIGFAYSGDVVLADRIVSILNISLSNLFVEGGDNPLISWKEIQDHVLKVLRVINDNYSAIQPMDTTFLIFGYFDDRYCVTKLKSPKYGMPSIEEIDLYSQRWCSMGSVASHFNSNAGENTHQARQELSTANNLLDRSKPADRDKHEVDVARARRNISQILRKTFSDLLKSQVQGIGGTLQLVEVTEHFIVFLKTDLDDLLGADGIESVGRFQVLLVSER